ncbi:anti-sigma F factor [Iocasia frigidifontis]|uniref:Anti-sigma F factor n=1 Tax=Iocasia fonsfrigidae TaxID=2682810 RepID=A0A8A7KKV6_9FIRM|nr:anti-sigma F factor [Iocasia fonsfrigidae]QTL98482.1 anti-sigma F factor [Iocasia fonsfrigidae]
MHNKAHLTLLGKSSNVGLARITTATFASELDFTLSELEEIKVAVSEAVTNCIIHAYPMDEGIIELDLEIEDCKLIIIIKDQGIGIKDIEAVLQPSYSTKEEHMGLGLAFIDSFMDEFKLISEIDEGTTLRMIKIPEQLKNTVE